MSCCNSDSADRPFLTAHWLRLVLLNFRADAAKLSTLVPAGLELDTFAGQAYVSIVGFSFEQTRFGRLPACAHRCFPEVNLRYYVRRNVASEVRRGVVFVKEIVPRPLVALLANRIYGENYVVRQMPQVDAASTGGEKMRYGYQWIRPNDGAVNKAISATDSRLRIPRPGSLDEFIVEHYYGYSCCRGRTLEYRVAHPPWRVAAATHVQWCCDAAAEYGPPWCDWLVEPASAILADGSDVTVFRGRSLETRRTT